MSRTELSLNWYLEVYYGPAPKSSERQMYLSRSARGFVAVTDKNKVVLATVDPDAYGLARPEQLFIIGSYGAVDEHAG